MHMNIGFTCHKIPDHGLNKLPELEAQRGLFFELADRQLILFNGEDWVLVKMPDAFAEDNTLDEP